MCRGDTMTERQQLIAKKLHILSVKKTLGRLSGIDIIGIVDENENNRLRQTFCNFQP